MHNYNSYILYTYVYIYVYSMYNNRMYINIMFMYIIHNISTCMFTTYDVKITVEVQSHLKRCFALTKNDAIESVQSLRYEKLPPGRSEMALDTGFCKRLSTNSKRTAIPAIPKKGSKERRFFVASQHCTFSHVCCFNHSPTSIYWSRNKPEKKTNEEEVRKKKMFLLHPWKLRWNPKIHLFGLQLFIFQGALPFTSDRCSPLLRYYATMLLCYYAMVGVWVDDLSIYWNGAVVYFFKPVYVFISCWKIYVVPTDEFIFQIFIMCHSFRMFFLIQYML